MPRNRLVRFSILPPVGDEIQEVSGSLRDLLGSIPYLFAFSVIPPRTILNEILASGVEDAGMSGGCTWDPFQLGEDEFESLRAELEGVELDGRILRYVPPPGWVKTREHWIAWCVERAGRPEPERGGAVS